jgi:Flp pilus assembly pilin Flp
LPSCARNYDLSLRLQGMISLVDGANAGYCEQKLCMSVFDSISKIRKRGMSMELVRRLWSNQEGQDIAEYAVMLAVILVIVVGTVRLIGSNANNVFSSVASSIQ